MKKMSKRILFVFILILYLVVPCRGFFEFLWGGGKNEEVSTELRKLPSVLYELPEQDQEFLKEAIKLTNSEDSALDQCQHRVIMKLDSDCHKLDSEALGKLSVMIMNCQFASEGRSSKMFPCTPEMSLKQCTIGMDSQIYQMYHTIMNRVQALCISKRQDQFRGLAEMTINKLMKTTQEQVSIAQDLLSGQIRLNEMTQDNIKEIDENDAKIKAAQIQTIELTKKGSSMLEASLQELKKEKDMITEIQNQLLTSQDSLISNADIIENLQKSNLKLTKEFEKTKKQLNEINELIQYFLDVVKTLKGFCENFMEFIRELGIDVKAENFNIVAVNLIYMFLGMVVLNFLGATMIFKYIFVGFVGLNVLAHIFDSGMPLLTVNNMFMTSWIVTAFVTWLMKFIAKMKLRFSKKDDDSSSEEEEPEKTPARNSVARQTTRRSVTPSASTSHVNNLSNLADREMSDIFSSTQNSIQSINSSSSISVMTPAQINSMERPATPYNRPVTPAMRRVMSDSAGSEDNRANAGTPFIPGMVGRIACQALTQKGLPCKNAASVGFSFCRVHNR